MLGTKPRSGSPPLTPRPPTRYDASVCHRDGSNGFTHIPGTHLDDPRRKQRLCSPARVAVRRAPSPLLSINIYLISLLGLRNSFDDRPPIREEIKIGTLNVHHRTYHLVSCVCCRVSVSCVCE